MCLDGEQAGRASLGSTLSPARRQRCWLKTLVLGVGHDNPPSDSSNLWLFGAGMGLAALIAIWRFYESRCESACKRLPSFSVIGFQTGTTSGSFSVVGF